MNIFSIGMEIREVGLNYGLPMWVVEFGPGMSLTVEDFLIKISRAGLRKKDWILLKDCIGERGVVVTIEALKSGGAFIEVEATSLDQTPPWFPKVDRWVVYWKGKGDWNIGALRPKQDLLLCESNGVEEFSEATKEYSQADKGLIANGNIPDIVIKNRWRVYRVVK